VTDGASLSVVPGGGIEPPTRGFSSKICRFSYVNIDKHKSLFYGVFIEIS
jgi:hypothetical protein